MREANPQTGPAALLGVEDAGLQALLALLLALRLGDEQAAAILARFARHHEKALAGAIVSGC